ncbi:MAG TPA: tripartite tricarboxylate transporter TctB family protein [Verrucomicrobiales bacterium]|nr:tripartite tricarboxylate transporter TctB family protein [Verrucomicrobiales bacterium]
MTVESLDEGKGRGMADAAVGRRDGLGFGIFLLALGGLGMVWGLRMEVPGFVSQGDPGPRTFPLTMSAVLLAGGLWQCLRVLWSGRSPERAQAESRGRWIRWCGVAGGLTGFAALLPWTGFRLAAFLFVAIYLRASGLVWWKGLGSAALLVVAIEILFGWLFRVQLPAGRLGLPF